MLLLIVTVQCLPRRCFVIVHVFVFVYCLSIHAVCFRLLYIKTVHVKPCRVEIIDHAAFKFRPIYTTMCVRVVLHLLIDSKIRCPCTFKTRMILNFSVSIVRCGDGTDADWKRPGERSDKKRNKTATGTDEWTGNERPVPAMEVKCDKRKLTPHPYASLRRSTERRRTRYI